MASNSVRVIIVAFIMNMGIALAKFIAFLVTGSAAMLAEACQSGEMRLALRQADIAVRLNLSRKAVNAALKALADLGLVRTGYGQIWIMDRIELAAFSNPASGQRLAQ